MRCIAITTPILISLLAAAVKAPGQKTDPPLDEVIAGARQSIATFSSALPSIYCDESLHSYEIRGGKTKREQTATTLIQVRRQDGNSKEPFKEERKFRSVDGKTLPEGTAVRLDLPLMLNGGFGDDFSVFFGKDSAACNKFQILDDAPIPAGDGLALKISLGQNAAQNGTCIKLPTDGAATFWLNRGTWQVLRAEFHYPQSKVGTFSGLSIIKDFAAIPFGEKSYVIPAKVYAAMGKASGNDMLVYQAEYSNCHKFETTMRILPEASDIPR